MNSDLDIKNFYLQLELGDHHEKIGEINKGLEHFKNAYHMAVILKDKKRQVDALVRIMEAYLFKGEIETSITYAKMAEDILKDLNYVQGKLDISLYLFKIYTHKNEHYKAREIGNQALKLCTEEYTVYKGRILNSLAWLSSELTSVDEHLELLQQSLHCFEKVNDDKGIFGTLNNIGTVYAEKLQDDEKSLEYFFKLKEKSEDANYSQFNTFANVNIGEVYFKCLRYEEAISYCEVALLKAKADHMGLIVFYAYSMLVRINIKLYNYKEAYNYYNLDIIELEKYPKQVESLSLFYVSSATLLLEFGEINKADNNIKQALDLIGNAETITKWNAGIIYEFVKLKQVKNVLDIPSILEGIKFLLTKFKNSEAILNIVYNTALELLTLKQEELAFKLVDEYMHIEIKVTETILKAKYIEALRKDDFKMQELKIALKLAKEAKQNKLALQICNSLGEGYFKLNDYKNALTYYVEACRLIKNIVGTVPEEFKIRFINVNKFLETYNKAVKAKKEYYNYADGNDSEYNNIHNEDELIEFLKKLDNMSI